MRIDRRGFVLIDSREREGGKKLVLVRFYFTSFILEKGCSSQWEKNRSIDDEGTR
jgi:hypothetical protein